MLRPAFARAKSGVFFSRLSYLECRLDRLFHRHQSPANVGPARSELVGHERRRSSLAHLFKAIKLAPGFIGQKHGRLATNEQANQQSTEARQHHQPARFARYTSPHGSMVSAPAIHTKKNSAPAQSWVPAHRRRGRPEFFACWSCTSFGVAVPQLLRCSFPAGSQNQKAT